jgi:sugar transferase (PEP-CTERM/EpsH1 system associated)
MTKPRPLVAHVVHRFATGGLENGVVNLVNRLDGCRHAIVALTEIDPAFASRVERGDTEWIALKKPPGHGWRHWPEWTRRLKALGPSLVHTRNIGALEMQPAAWWAGVPVRIHGEHGWDTSDLGGVNAAHLWTRRAHRPWVHQWIALSREIEGYLRDRIGIGPHRLARICNGVDTERFAPRAVRQPLADCPFDLRSDLWLVGTVGRMQMVKAQPLLVRAFATVLRRRPELRSRLRLAMVGDGPLREQCRRMLEEEGLAGLAWLPGERRDVPDVMKALDCFVLPSMVEGISNTILEAMACGVPVVATRVGGNPDLVDDGRNGRLVPPSDADAMADAIEALATDAPRALELGRNARAEVERSFSLRSMAAAYSDLYDRLSAQHLPAR